MGNDAMDAMFVGLEDMRHLGIACKIQYVCGASFLFAGNKKKV